MSGNGEGDGYVKEREIIEKLEKSYLKRIMKGRCAGHMIREKLQRQDKRKSGKESMRLRKIVKKEKREVGKEMFEENKEWVREGKTGLD